MTCCCQTPAQEKLRDAAESSTDKTKRLKLKKRKEQNHQGTEAKRLKLKMTGF